MPITKTKFYELPITSMKSYLIREDILAFLAKHKDQAFTISEIAKELNLLDRKVKWNLSKLKRLGNVDCRAIYFIWQEKKMGADKK